ncbi:MAG: Glu-tRNA(Gln) amidotransferase subunit GatE [Candidatus Neomarinimicrobiota bacterium]
MTELMKPFEQMTDEDYTELGLQSGLEIHQQILTEKKLFCRCPAGHYSTAYDAEILRHMRPTLSELGEYDGTALMEFKTRKEIIYQINRETVCTYEMDDTPPFEINPHALEIAFQIAMLMNYKLVNEIHIARKQYLDGSIPTGFQRTTIVGVDGFIPYKNRNIGLIQLGLEEDSCREVSDIGHRRVYRADRLGMPLIETVTHPEMHTPQEVADVANILRWLVKSSGLVRTGIGSARQDVNVSIAGGTRIEIKGVHRIPLIPLLIYNEAMRQRSLLLIREDLRNRGITEATFKAETADVTYLLTNTQWDPIRWALQHDEKVACVKLKGYSGILSYPTQTGKVFSKEISDRVRVIACLTRLPNILTSESTEETIGSHVWNRIRRIVGATSQDALVIVWGNPQDLQTAVQEIVIRAREATIGVPGETRQALVDGTNGFERILPGPERMYPDTDLPPLEFPPERVEVLRKSLPPPIWERRARYKTSGIPDHLIIPIAASPRAVFFDRLIETNDLSSKFCARIFFEKAVAWRRVGLPVEKLTDAIFTEFFGKIAAEPSLQPNAERILHQLLTSEQSLATIIEAFSPISISSDDIRAVLVNIDKSEPPKSPQPEANIRYFMGKLMMQFQFKLPAKTILPIVGEFVKNGRRP